MTEQKESILRQKTILLLFNHPYQWKRIMDRFTLDKAVTNVKYCVDRVPEEDSELLKFLVEQSILPDEEITVIGASTSLGVITIKTKYGEIAIGYSVAGRIWLHTCV